MNSTRLYLGRLLLFVGGSILTFALLTVAESACRHLERVRIDRQLPPQLQTLPPKTVSELRVFAFGGSTVYGDPVPKLGFVSQIQYWLQRLYPDRNVRIYNFGQRGKNTAYVLNELTRKLDDQPDLVVVMTGGNEFLYWEPEGQIARIRGLVFSHFATMRILQDDVNWIMSSPKVDLMPCQLAIWDHESPSFKRRITTFEENMNLIVERARQKSVKLIVATLPSNLSDWPPVYKGLEGRDRRYAETVLRIQDLLRKGHNQEASDAVANGFRLYPDDAMLYFLRGRSQSLTGNYAEARQSFKEARDLDPLPWRATTQINSIIRKVASGVDGVYLVDLEKIFEEHSQNGLVGFDLIADNGHSTPLGESLTAQTIIQTMVQLGYLPDSAQAQSHCCPIDSFLAEAGYFKPKSTLRLQALLDTATFAMKTPFLNFEASRKYLLEAMKVDQNSWEVWANLATLSYFAGDTAAGARELRRATELHHAALDVNDRNETPYLKEALEYSAARAGTCGALLQSRPPSVQATTDRPPVAGNGHEI